MGLSAVERRDRPEGYSVSTNNEVEDDESKRTAEDGFQSPTSQGRRRKSVALNFVRNCIGVLALFALISFGTAAFERTNVKDSEQVVILEHSGENVNVDPISYLESEPTEAATSFREPSRSREPLKKIDKGMRKRPHRKIANHHPGISLEGEELTRPLGDSKRRLQGSMMGSGKGKGKGSGGGSIDRSGGRTFNPTPTPSASPTRSPPSRSPSAKPSVSPSNAPSLSKAPSSQPSQSPSGNPSLSFSPSRSKAPSESPSLSTSPSSKPSASPSNQPSLSTAPSRRPSVSPSRSPSAAPTFPRGTFPPTIAPTTGSRPIGRSSSRSGKGKGMGGMMGGMMGGALGRSIDQEEFNTELQDLIAILPPDFLALFGHNP